MGFGPDVKCGVFQTEKLFKKFCSGLHSAERADIHVKFGKICFIFEPPHKKTNNLHMRKLRRRSAVQ